MEDLLMMMGYEEDLMVLEGIIIIGKDEEGRQLPHRQTGYTINTSFMGSWVITCCKEECSVDFK